MDVHASSILDFFSGEKQCVVPLFQRRYSWGERQWKTLWEDLQSCMNNSSEGKASPHFLGAVVTMKVPGGITGVSRCQVIDGQQRLSTVSILLSAMASLAEGRDHDRIQAYLINPHEENEGRLKLLPTSHDRDAFRRVIHHDKDLPRHPIVAAYKFFLGKLNNAEPQVSDWLQVVRDRLTVVEIALDGSDDAYLIFESLNHKGQPLTQADLIRNHLMMRLESADPGLQDKVYRSDWDPMEQRVRDAVVAGSGKGGAKQQQAAGDKALTEFFRSDLMRHKGDKVVRRRVYDEARRRFSELDEPDRLRDEVARLNEASRHVAKFHDPTLEFHEGCRQPLETLAILGQTTPHTLMLEMYDQGAEGRINEDELAVGLSAIESFIVRRLWVGLPTNQLQRLFYSWASALHRERPREPIDWLRSQMLDGKKARRWPDDNEFVSALSEQDCYNRKGAKLLLVKIEKSFGHKEEVSLDRVSIEHIIPQQLSAEWEAGYSPQEVETLIEYRHRLGNLTLTGYNSELGNLPFPKKREEYLKSHIEMTKRLGKYSEFSIGEVKSRGKEMAVRAAGVWPRL